MVVRLERETHHVPEKFGSWFLFTLVVHEDADWSMTCEMPRMTHGICDARCRVWCVECRRKLPLSTRVPFFLFPTPANPVPGVSNTQDVHRQASGRTMIDWLNVNTMCKRLLIVVSTTIHCWSITYFWLPPMPSIYHTCSVLMLTDLRTYSHWSSNDRFLLIPPRFQSCCWKPKLVRLMIDCSSSQKERKCHDEKSKTKFKIRIVSLGNASCFIHESMSHIAARVPLRIRCALLRGPIIGGISQFQYLGVE